MKPMYLPRGAVFIIEGLNKAGYRADAVGGCVRDFFLGRRSDDYDITTAATPDTVKAVFSDLRTIDTGIRHGTVTVLAEGGSFEVTTYRVDGKYLDNRHPESVSFTDTLADDLARRDFTVNAMCYNPTDGYTDLFGGREDLATRTIRAVGDPTRRFSEDALRILRAIRFASVLGFDLDPSTASAARREQARLASVSRERIYVELSKLIAGQNAYKIISTYLDIITTATGGITVKRLPDAARFAAADYMSRLLSIFYINGYTKEDYSAAMRNLKTDNRIRTVGESTLSLIDSATADTDTDILLLMKKAGAEVAREVLKLGILLGRADPTVLDRLDRLIRENRPYRVSDLVIRGNDLIGIGIRGRDIGDTLDLLLDKAIRGECPNEREALLACAKESDF